MMSYSKEYLNRFVSELNKDDIEYLKEQLNKKNDKKSKYLEFIRLNEKAHKLISCLKNVQITSGKSWDEIVWDRLFSDEFYHKAYKIYPFHYCDVDASYEDEISWLMSGWDEAVYEVKKELEVDDMLENF